MARDAYKSEKRRKELERQKKQAEKREKRLKKNEERSEAEVLADLFGMPYEAGAEGAAEAADPEKSEGAGADAGEAAGAGESPSPEGSTEPDKQ